MQLLNSYPSNASIAGGRCKRSRNLSNSKVVRVTAYPDKANGSHSLEPKYQNGQVQVCRPESPTSSAATTTQTHPAETIPATKASEQLAQIKVSLNQIENQQEEIAAKLAGQSSATIIVPKPLPKVLILHTGGTLGMDPEIIEASGGQHASLRPATMLANVLSVVPELRRLSNVDLQVVCNKDSSRVRPEDWIKIAKILDAHRKQYDAFMIIHGTDTMAYTAAAVSLMLRGFNRPVVFTGSQLPLAAPRTDARQNLLASEELLCVWQRRPPYSLAAVCDLCSQKPVYVVIDAIQCATTSFSPPHVNFKEVAICFGGRLLRGNRSRKVHSSSYQAFDSPGYPHLADMGIDVSWNERVLLRPEGAYVPRFKLDPRVIRIPVVPGIDPQQAYGDLISRGVRGIVLEVFGLGNLPDLPEFGWLPWLQDQITKGLQVALVSQCEAGPLQPDLYAAGDVLNSLTLGSDATGGAAFGYGGGSGMTPECAVAKLMLTLAYPDLAVGEAIAGEL